MTPTSGEITRLLADWGDGDAEALEQLMPLVFDDLRRIARQHFRAETPGHTLQPTALVNEVYVRLTHQRQVQWESRGQFFAFSGMLMRRILVDHAKRRRASKRGGDVQKLPLTEGAAITEAGDVDILALDSALSHLAELDPRAAQVVELRYFVGLTQDEVAEALDVSPTTVKRDWQAARLMLYRMMAPEPAEVAPKAAEDAGPPAVDEPRMEPPT